MSRTKSALIPLPAPVSPHVPWDQHQSTSFSSPSEMCLLLHPPRVRLLLSHSGINNELNSSSLRSAQVAHLNASISPVHPTTTTRLLAIHSEAIQFFSKRPRKAVSLYHRTWNLESQNSQSHLSDELLSSAAYPSLRTAAISLIYGLEDTQKKRKKNLSYQERTPNPLLKTSLRSKRHLLLPRSHQSADNHNRGSTYITLHVIRRIQHALLTEARSETLDDPRITIRKSLFSLRLYPHQERNPLQKTTRPRKALHSSLPNRKTSR